MLPEYKARTNLFVGIGFALQILSRYLERTGQGSPEGVLVLALAGLGIFTYGCTMYTRGKGYSGALGLLGLLSCVGLVVLVLLPDRHKDAKPAPPGDT